MKTTENSKAKAYKLSFLINTIIGGLMLLLAMGAAFFETIFPTARGQLVWGFLPATLLCWFIASLHYSKYLSLTK